MATPFALKSARFHKLNGLFVTDADGQEFQASAKKSVLDSGFVLFLWYNEDTPCPYQIRLPNPPFGGDLIEGTDDPSVVALARILFDNAPKMDGAEWVSLPVPQHANMGPGKMKYPREYSFDPEPKEIQVGDLVWWNEGACVGFVEDLIEDNNDRKDYGLEEPGVALTNLHPFEANKLKHKQHIGFVTNGGTVIYPESVGRANFFL